jgi:uncharacterized membrane protein YfcA
MLQAPMPDLSPLTIAALAGVAFFAGLVDAIAGGGGLLTVPALLAAGLPPHLALGTNKGQSVFGSGAAMVGFWRAGLIDPARARVGFPLGLLGSLGGAALVLAVPAASLKPIVLVLLAGAALFIGLRRSPRPAASGPAPAVDGPAQPAPPATAVTAPPHAAPNHTAPNRATTRPLLAGLIALVVGAYDGFFGPGTGTFLIVAFVALLGDGLARASASAKVVNFASNLAALALFAWRGVVVWPVALPMAVGQLCGGWIGAHLAVRRGDALVRRVAVVSALALAVKLALDLR